MFLCGLHGLSHPAKKQAPEKDTPGVLAYHVARGHLLLDEGERRGGLGTTAVAEQSGHRRAAFFVRG